MGPTEDHHPPAKRIINDSERVPNSTLLRLVPVRLGRRDPILQINWAERESSQVCYSWRANWAARWWAWTWKKLSFHDSERETEIYVSSPGYISLPSSHCTLQTLCSCLWTGWNPRYHSTDKQKHPAIISSHFSCNNILSSIIQFFRKYCSKFRVLQPAPSWGMPEQLSTYHAASHLVANCYSIAMCI